MISIKDVSKKFSNGVLSLDKISFEVKKGSVLGLIGTNGAGKSTLLRIISGILREDEGEVLVNGEKIFENSRIKSKISFVSDEGYLLNNFTLDSMADMYASMRENFSREIFTTLTSRMNLDTKRRINTFSKGMKRQGEVILALSSGTEYLFFDETFDGLDPIARESARKMIAEAVADLGSTVILSSHNLSEIENICDSVALLDRGRLLFHKGVSEAVENCRKYQVVLDREIDASPLAQSVTALNQSGKLLTFVASLDENGVLSTLSSLYPDAKVIYTECVALTLEEIFTLEVKKAQAEGRIVND